MIQGSPMSGLAMQNEKSEPGRGAKDLVRWALPQFLLSAIAFALVACICYLVTQFSNAPFFILMNPSIEYDS